MILFIIFKNKILDLNLNRHRIPEDFLTFCEVAKNNEPINRNAVEVNIELNCEADQREILNNPMITKAVTSAKRKLERQLQIICKRLKNN